MSAGRGDFKLSAKRLELLESLRRERGLSSARPERIPRCAEAEAYPLSFGQQRLWFLDRLQPGSAAYNLRTALRLRGDLSLPALGQALTTLVERHASLRTTFGGGVDKEGEPVQRLEPPEPFSLPVVDLGALAAPRREPALRRLAAAEAGRPFDLERGPLLRVLLLRLAPDEHALVATLHHIVADGWSLEIFTRDLAALYRGIVQRRPGELPALPIRYVDYACWQRDRARAGELDLQLSYWRERLAGAPRMLELPADRPRPAVPSFRGGVAALAFDPAACSRLLELARREEATPFMALLALLAVLLRGHADAAGDWEDVLVGTPIANRQRPEVEGVVGYFANTLVLRAELAGDPSFRTLLSRVREATLGAQAHQDLPFERLVEELQPQRNLGQAPLFQVLLVVQHLAPSSAGLADLSIAPLPLPAGAVRVDLAVMVDQIGSSLRVGMEYSADLFDAATVRRLLARFEALAEAAGAAPHQPLSELPLATPSERHQVTAEWNDWGDVAPAPRELPTLHGLFAARAARGPERVAISIGDEWTTYGELDRRAERLARRLRAAGAVPGATVGLVLDRSAGQVAAILGVLKAGAAYLPLDPGSPAERLAFTLRDAGASLAIGDEGLSPALGGEVRFVFLEGADGSPEVGAADEPGRGAELDDLAYVIYTSGSTGRPKGVMVSHRAVCGTLRWRLAAFSLSPEDCVLQNIAFTFDPSLWQIFGALLSGARLALVPPGAQQDFAGLVRTAARERVTITDLAPSMLRAFLEQEGLEDCGALRLLFAGGEELPPELAAGFAARFPAAVLQNIYGPTEGAIDAATGTFQPRAGLRTVPIGRPVAGKRLALLDCRLRPLPIGVPSELYIGGPGLARGYLGRPELTAERFLPDPGAEGEPGARLYRTGDLARHLPDGAVEFLGRVDRQVKVRGVRVELGEVEAALARHPGVRECCVVLGRDAGGEAALLAYVAPDSGPETGDELRAFLRRDLPAHLVPSSLVVLAALPRTASGKVDVQALPAAEAARRPAPSRGAAPLSATERAIAEVWCEVLGVERVGTEDNFFDLGGHSLLLVRVHGKLQKRLDRELPILDLFQHPTVGALARHLGGGPGEGTERRRATPGDPGEPAAAGAVAVVGMAGRFPGARDVAELWANLRAGRETIRFFTDEELLAAGIPEALLARPGYVKARGAIDGYDLFDADFFEMGAREAEVLDPQHRIFLECAWQALEDAGCDPGRFPGAIGVYAGVSANTYFVRNLLGNPEALLAAGISQALLGGDKDFLATRASYKLNLRGPSLTVQTACSTSLVAVHLACRALLGRECDLALAGGVSVAVPQVEGYLYQEGGINSPDGHCRAFDALARGTVAGSGAGVVVLRRLADALAAGDRILAVIRGTAINNDGAAKVGYTAPSIDGQAEVVAAAQAAAGLGPDDIGYVEAHGTATPLGDPIEVAALAKAFAGTARRGYCAIGSVKTNIGHLDAAAGVAGLIKAVLALDREEIPPSLHFARPNPRIDFAASPFRVNAALAEWKRGPAPRRAGVSSFGIGGTNAHAVLEEAPPPLPAGPARPLHLLPLSARSEAALEAATDGLATYLQGHGDGGLADIAFTLQAGRKAFRRRRVLVAREPAEAAEALASRDPARLLDGAFDGGARPIAFLFPGQGAQYPGMGRELYREEPAFRSAIDDCAEILAPHLDGFDLRSALYPEAETEEAGRRLAETELAQPALFAVEYALARLWQEWGIRPEAMLGHSIGEYVAACLAGVFPLADALLLVAVRGRLMQALPRGAMLAVPLAEAEAEALLPGTGLALAAINAPAMCVLSGAEVEVELIRARLAGRGIEGRRLHTSHAFHSAAMEPILAAFAEEVGKTRLEPPAIPFLSNLTGTWIEPAQATDPAYWASHLRRPVRFAAAIGELLAEPSRVLLEVGPGGGLGSLARRQAAPGVPVLRSLRGPGAEGADQEDLLGALGRLWLAGVEVDWEGFHAHGRRRRVALPTYPFERRRYWVEPVPRRARERPLPAGSPERLSIADWFSAPAWRESVLPLPPGGDDVLAGRWLLFLDDEGWGEALAAELAGSGAEVLAVRAGTGFARTAEREWTIDPGRAGDYRRLLDEALRAAGPGSRPPWIVHLWSVTGEPVPLPAALERGFHSLLLLARVVGERGAGSEVEISVVSDHLQEVAGEGLPHPEKSTLLGPVRVIPLEYPGVACRSIDVAAPPEPRAVAALQAELRRPALEPIVALRGGRRWVQRFERVDLAPAGTAGGRLRPGGVVLVTGGLGGIGLEIAGHLARSAGARLVLVGRTELPPREEWERLLAEGRGSAALRERIGRLLALEAAGAEVLALAGDVADETAMRGVVARAVERFGAIHGVVHAAGVAGGGVIQLQERARAEEVLAPKVRGTLVLAAALAPVVERSPLDFFVVCSSLAAILGGAGKVAYSAANAFLDGFAAREAALGRAVVAIDWDAWREVGMAAAAPGGAPAEGLLNREGLEALDRVLASRLPRVAVSTLGLDRLRERRRAAAPPAPSPAPETRAPAAHSRPALATPYAAPRSDTERLLAGIWEEVLGIAPVGIHDEFTELGGHSLLALQVVSRIRAKLAADLPLSALFDAPTVARLAVRLLAGETAAAEGEELDRLLAEIDGISDEEAEALLADGSPLAPTEAGVEGAREAR